MKSDISEANRMEIINSTVSFAKSKMKGLPPSHDWNHVLRVISISEKIAAVEKADLFIVKISAILHDIARDIEDQSKGEICHAALGSTMAENFLIEQGLDKKRIFHVSECIKTHRYRNNHTPDTIEAKVLYDADKLDSIGAIGIGRAFLFSGEIGATLHNPEIDISDTRAYSKEDTAYREFHVKLRHVEEKMLTREGKRLAHKRHTFMIKFFEQLNAEFKGDV